MNNHKCHLIIGSSGFIGRSVAQLLISLGYKVILTKRPKSCCYTEYEGIPYVSYREVDLLYADWETVIRDVDVIHHYAWNSVPSTANENPIKDLSDNLIPSLSLLQAILRSDRRPRIVFASSGGTVYGRVNKLPIREDCSLQPFGAYAITKVSFESYLRYFRESFGIDCCVARIANPYGAGQRTDRGQGAASIFLRKAMEKKLITIWGDGSAIRDYIYITDVANGLVALALQETLDENWIFNIGGGRGTSINEIIKEIEIVVGHDVQVEWDIGRPYDVPANILDITLAKTVLNWHPMICLNEGLTLMHRELLAGMYRR